MRHQKLGRHFSRTSEHRHAMFSNMIAALILHERIETTDPKAKTLKRLADRTISWGTSVGDILVKPLEKRTSDERAAVVHAIRMAKRGLRHEEALAKLFAEVAPRFRGRTGGFTRVLKTRQRPGDAAPMSFIELVVKAAPAEAAPAPEPEEGGKKKKAAKVEASAKAEKKAKPEKAEKADKGADKGKKDKAKK